MLSLRNSNWGKNRKPNRWSAEPVVIDLKNKTKIGQYLDIKNINNIRQKGFLGFDRIEKG